MKCGHDWTERNVEDVSPVCPSCGDTCPMLTAGQEREFVEAANAGLAGSLIQLDIA